MPFRTEKLKQAFLAEFEEGYDEGATIREGSVFNETLDCGCCVGIVALKEGYDPLTDSGQDWYEVVDWVAEHFGLTTSEVYAISDAWEEWGYTRTITTIIDTPVWREVSK